MKYILYLLLIAVIFGLVALVDFLLKRIFPKARPNPGCQAVRLPRYSSILGLLMTLLGLIALLYIPRQEQLALWLGCWVVLAIGVYLLVNFFWFGIFYDDEGFTYRPFLKKGRYYRYEEITGQRAYLAKSGWNTNLYARDDEIQLYAALQGVSEFLNKAFFAWCRQKGIDPDTVENDPHMLVFFPEPEDP